MSAQSSCKDYYGYFLVDYPFQLIQASLRHFSAKSRKPKSQMLLKMPIKAVQLSIKTANSFADSPLLSKRGSR